MSALGRIRIRSGGEWVHFLLSVPGFDSVVGWILWVAYCVANAHVDWTQVLFFTRNWDNRVVL